MSETVNIAGIARGAVLAALYNASKPQGMGFMQYDPTPMTAEQGDGLLKRTTDFDYLKGRVMKITIDSDILDVRWYDRDNGEGTAAKAIASLRTTLDPANTEIIKTHQEHTLQSAETTQSHLNEETTINDTGNVVVVSLGLSDMKYHLNPKIEQAKNQNKKK